MRRTHTQRDSVTDGRRATQYLLRSLSDGEGNNNTYYYYYYYYYYNLLQNLSVFLQGLQ